MSCVTLHIVQSREVIDGYVADGSLPPVWISSPVIKYIAAAVASALSITRNRFSEPVALCDIGALMTLFVLYCDVL